MPTNEFNPSSCTNFHLEGYEVTIDNFDMKISDFEIKNQPPPHQPYNMPVGVSRSNFEAISNYYQNQRKLQCSW